MVRANPNSTQIDLFSNVGQFLSPRELEKFNDPGTWHSVVLDQVTKLIREGPFAELFDEHRP